MLAAMVSPSISLTEDILIEIFTHLPLNSICKLKCLSKVWSINLSNPNFIIKWFKTNTKSLPWIRYHRIFNCDSDEKPLRIGNQYPDLYSEFMSRNGYLFSFKFLMNQKPFQGAKVYLLGSSNGLVLCWTPSSYNRRSGYHVCNPLTQTWVSLPEPPSHRFDVIESICCEYSSSTYRSCYKVVLIPNFYMPSKKFNVDIFSSDLGVWQSFQVSCGEKAVLGNSHYNNVFILNSVLFWRQDNRMLVYNLNQNTGSDGHQCSLIDLPDDGSQNAAICNFNSCIAESQGWVCYSKTRETEMGTNVSVWVLNEFKWKILHKDISAGYHRLCSRIGNDLVTQVLGFSPTDRNVVLLGSEYWFQGFNLQTRSFEGLCSDERLVCPAGVVFLPFMLTPMPTILPAPSWIDT